MVAVDGSTRVGFDNFLLELNIVRELVYGLNMDADSQMAALVYSNQPYVQFYLSTFDTQRDILAALSLPYPYVSVLRLIQLNVKCYFFLRITRLYSKIQLQSIQIVSEERVT